MPKLLMSLLYLIWSEGPRADSVKGSSKSFLHFVLLTALEIQVSHTGVFCNNNVENKNRKICQLQVLF